MTQDQTTTDTAVLTPGRYRMSIDLEVHKHGYLLPHDTLRMIHPDWWIERGATFEPTAQDKTTDTASPDQRFRDMLGAATLAVANELDLDDRDLDLLDLVEDVAVAMLSRPEGVTVADVMERREQAGHRPWMG